MLALKTPLNKAEKVKKYLFEKQSLDKTKKPKKGKKYIYFPVIKKEKEALSFFPGLSYINCSLFQKGNKKEYKEYLAKKLYKEYSSKIPSSYDIIGDIIIIEINQENKRIEKEIGKALLRAHKNIKVILKKSGQHEGEFRTQRLEFLSGEKRKETIYKENNIFLRLDVEKVYFSPRLSTERKRIFEEVKEGETILVMFSGCAPYPITLSKNTKAKEIIGIEKNPVAHKYATQNLLINRAKNVELKLGDVREIIPVLNKTFDRILMPLPKGAEDFLDLAFFVSKKGTIIHFYDFEHEKEFSKGEEKVKKAAKENNKEIKILRTLKCGQYSPGKYRICVDFQII